jgi:hypothetical protein
MRFAHVGFLLRCEIPACADRLATLICASQQGGTFPLVAFLDVSSLNSAVPQGTAAFFVRSAWLASQAGLSG